MAIAGDPAATDPACVKSPIHARMANFIAAANSTESERTPESFVYRRIGVVTEPA
jgi:pyrroloquinoline quinone biosynthesis protein E